MKLLITGATGLIGQELVRAALSHGHTVHYLTTSKDKIVNQESYQGFYWSPQQGIIDENCMYGVDAIIHLAGASISKRWTSSYKQELIESRIVTADLLYNVVKKSTHQVKHFISASGTASYPEGNTMVYDETTKELEDSFLSQVVQKWEASSNRFESLGIPVSLIRTGLVLSNTGGALPQMIKPVQWGVGAVMGSGKQMISWIHIKDLIAIYIFVLDHHLGGVFNAVAPNPVNNRDFTKVMARVVHKPLFLPAVPQFLMQLILGEMSYLLFSSKNLSAHKIIGAGYCFQFSEVEVAIANLYA